MKLLGNRTKSIIDQSIDSYKELSLLGKLYGSRIRPFRCSFWRLMKGDKTNKRQNDISFLRFGDLYNATNEQTTKRNGRKTSFCRVVVLSFWRLVKVDKTNKRQNEQVTTKNQTLIFRGNFVVLSCFDQRDKTNKRRNEIHFFVLATCTTRQNEQTKKWNSISLFSRLLVLAPWPTRQNEETKKWNSISSFCRLVQRNKTNKRRNEIPFLRFLVCSFWRLDQRDKTKKRRNEEMKFDFFVLATCTTRQNEQTKKWNLNGNIGHLVCL